MNLNKTQVAVLIGIVMLSAVLYFLPKKVLTNKSEATNRDKPVTETSSGSESTSAEVKSIETILLESISGLTEAEKKTLEAANHEDPALIKKAMNYYKTLDNRLGIAFCMEKQAGQHTGEAIGLAYYQAFKQSQVEENRIAIATKAISYLKPALDKKPESLELKSAWADCYINTATTDPMKGIMVLREVLKTDSNNEAALLLLGEFSIRSGQNDKAIPRFQKLVSLYPKNIKYSLYLAQLFSEKGEHDKALETLTEAKKYATRKSAKDSLEERINHLK